MSRKLPPKNAPLEKIPESLSGEYDSQAAESLDRKKIGITSFLNTLPNGQKIVNAQCQQAGPSETKIEQKDRMIKELQEEILERKLKNDMIQSAFQRRNEIKQEAGGFSRQISVLVENCKILAAHNRPFKRAYLRSLVTVCKASQVEKSKAVKSLLVWTINWLNHLFSFLSRAFTKK